MANSGFDKASDMQQLLAEGQALENAWKELLGSMHGTILKEDRYALRAEFLKRNDELTEFLNKIQKLPKNAAEELSQTEKKIINEIEEETDKINLLLSQIREQLRKISEHFKSTDSPFLGDLVVSDVAEENTATDDQATTQLTSSWQKRKISETAQSEKTNVVISSYKDKSNMLELLKEGQTLENQIKALQNLLTKFNLSENFGSTSDPFLKDSLDSLSDQIKMLIKKSEQFNDKVKLITKPEQDDINDVYQEILKINVKPDLDQLSQRLNEITDDFKKKWLNIYMIDDIASYGKDKFNEDQYRHSYIFDRKDNNVDVYYINKEGELELVELKDKGKAKIKEIINAMPISAVPVLKNAAISENNIEVINKGVRHHVTMRKDQELRDHFYHMHTSKIEEKLDESKTVDIKVESGAINLNTSTKLFIEILDDLFTEKNKDNVTFFQSDDKKNILVKYYGKDFNLSQLLQNVDWSHIPRLDKLANEAYLKHLRTDFSEGGSQVKPARPGTALPGKWKISLPTIEYGVKPYPENGEAELNNIYIKMGKKKFHYTIIRPEGKQIEGKIKKETLLSYEKNTDIQAKMKDVFERIKQADNQVTQADLDILKLYILRDAEEKWNISGITAEVKVNNVIKNIRDNDDGKYNYLGLSDAEIAALNIYTGPAYDLMNKLLRNLPITWQAEFPAKLHVLTSNDDYSDVSDKYFNQGITELLMHIAVASSALYKAKEWNSAEYDLLLMTINPEEKISHEKFKELLEANDKLPILIKQGNTISLYGFNGDVWELKELKSASFKELEFPPVDKTRVLLSHETVGEKEDKHEILSEEMKKEINEAHDNQFKSYVRQMDVSPENKLTNMLFNQIQDALAAESVHDVPAQAFQSTTNFPLHHYAKLSKDMVGLLYRGVAPGIVAVDASQNPGEGELLLPPGINLFYDSILKEGSAAIVSTNYVVTPTGRKEDPNDDAERKQEIELHLEEVKRMKEGKTRKRKEAVVLESKPPKTTISKSLRKRAIGHSAGTVESTTHIKKRRDAKSATQNVQPERKDEVKQEEVKKSHPSVLADQFNHLLHLAPAAPEITQPKPVDAPPPIQNKQRSVSAPPVPNASQATSKQKTSFMPRALASIGPLGSFGHNVSQERTQTTGFKVAMGVSMNNVHFHDQKDHATNEVKRLLNSAVSNTSGSIQPTQAEQHVELHEQKYIVVPINYGALNTVTMVTHDENGVKSDIYFREQNASVPASNKDNRQKSSKLSLDKTSIPSRELMQWAVDNVELFLRANNDIKKGITCDGFTRDQAEAIQIYCRSVEPRIFCSTNHLFDTKTLDKQVELFKKLTEKQKDQETFHQRET